MGQAATGDAGVEGRLSDAGVTLQLPGPDGGDHDILEGGAGSERPKPSCRVPEQQAWTVGRCDTLEIATWNIRNFPMDTGTLERLVTLIRQMDVDLIAVQEIARVSAFNELVSRLPGFAGVLSPTSTSGASIKKPASSSRRTTSSSLK